jgi:hypothetical protein
MFFPPSHLYFQVFLRNNNLNKVINQEKKIKHLFDKYVYLNDSIHYYKTRIINSNTYSIQTVTNHPSVFDIYEEIKLLNNNFIFLSTGLEPDFLAKIKESNNEYLDDVYSTICIFYNNKEKIITNCPVRSKMINKIIPNTFTKQNNLVYDLVVNKYE